MLNHAQPFSSNTIVESEANARRARAMKLGELRSRLHRIHQWPQRDHEYEADLARQIDELASQ